MLRVRLTFWYVGMLAGVLILFSVGFYSLFAKSLRQRLDGGLRSAAQVAALAMNHETEEHNGKREGEENFGLVLNTMHQTSFPRPNISVWEGNRLVAEKPGLAGAAARTIHSLTPQQHDEVVFNTQSAGRDSYRVIAMRLWVPSSRTNYTVYANETTEPIESELRTVLEILLVIVPVFLVAAAVGGYLLARKSLVPVLEMARAAAQIGSHNLSRRLPVKNPKDELGLLAATFNRLFERLDDAFDQQRQFMADASHELRTPVSVALTAAQVSLRSPNAPASALTETLEVIQAQMLRLRRVVEDLFTLTQADAGSYSPTISTFCLADVLDETMRAGRVLGDAKGVAVRLDHVLASAPVTGDEGLIRQLILILLDNAVKYTQPGGRVDISLESGNGEYRVRIADTGCGIPPADQARIFDRFYRVDKARGRKSPGAGSGAGLGLAIASWIVGLHGGRVYLAKSDSAGSEFVVALSAAAVNSASGENTASFAVMR